MIEPEGTKVSDLIVFTSHNTRGALPKKRTFGYDETLQLSEGSQLGSDRSQAISRCLKLRVP
ncbi:MAG: DUF1989 domain-containing protein [Erythrobacter sp.]|nr:DUF1989 domain-containing protein [Erythrobacter sp.]